MIVTTLNQQNSLINHFLYEIRDRNIQKDSARFRYNLKKCGEILAYEISKDLDYSPHSFSTPLAETKVQLIHQKIALGCILRASLPFFDGFLEMFPKAESGFVGAARKHTAGNEFEIADGYYGFPTIKDKTLIMIDPLLATGRSMVEVISKLYEKEEARSLIIASLIATPHALDHIETKLGDKVRVYTLALDPDLNEKYYIVPGLGDAGDLAFGPKNEI